MQCTAKHEWVNLEREIAQTFNVIKTTRQKIFNKNTAGGKLQVHTPEFSKKKIPIGMNSSETQQDGVRDWGFEPRKPT